jgi:inward rectifier potassium channel
VKLPPPRIDIRGLQAVKVGVRRFTLDDPYYLILTMRWPTFLAAVLTVFFTTNLIFATAYWLVPGSVTNARPGAFGDAFFFSVETLATVGYGVMTPASVYAHSVVTAEIFVGMFLTALLTGAFFARFARPEPKLVFSKPAVIGPYEDGTALMVRVASRRLQGISEASARISYLGHVPHGSTYFRRFTEMRLVRSNIPVLSLSWTLIHPIDEQSPLFGMTADDLVAEAPTLMVSISGFDEAISSMINDRKGYRPEDIRFGQAFENILRDLPGGFVEVDITRIHETAAADCGEDQDSAISDS